MERRFAAVAERNAWLTSQGTITERGVGDLLSACAALELHPRECATNILRGDRPFVVLDGDTRNEANLLFRACEPSDALTRCGEKIEKKRFIRDLSVGRIAPRPTTMKQNQRTTFTAFIERTDIAGKPGQAALVADGSPDGEPGSATGGQSASLVRYAPETCFELSAGEDFRIEGENPQCPAQLSSAKHVFAPKWFVTPLKGEVKRELGLLLILKRDDKTIEKVPIEPYPIQITVELEPSLPQKIQAWLVAWTGVGKTFEEFVLMIGSVITALAGLSIWGWLRRNRNADGDSGA